MKTNLISYQFITKLARQAKRTTEVKEEIAELRKHFKTSGWPLDLMLHEGASKSYSHIVANRILELSGFKIYYDPKKFAVLFKLAKGRK